MSTLTIAVIAALLIIFTPVGRVVGDVIRLIFSSILGVMVIGLIFLLLKLAGM